MKSVLLIFAIIMQMIVTDTVHYHYYADKGENFATQDNIQHKASRRVQIVDADGRYLSHAYARIQYFPRYQGEGELWLMTDMSNGYKKIEALGGERGKYLSHAFAKIWLQNGYQGGGEAWNVIRETDGKYLLRGLYGEKHLFLHSKNSNKLSTTIGRDTYWRLIFV